MTLIVILACVPFVAWCALLIWLGAACEDPEEERETEAEIQLRRLHDDLIEHDSNGLA